MRLGFIGLGTMGRPMATRLLNAGYSLICYDPNAESCATMQTAGATIASSAQEAAAAAPVALLSTSPERDDTILMQDPFHG